MRQVNLLPESYRRAERRRRFFSRLASAAAPVAALALLLGAVGYQQTRHLDRELERLRLEIAAHDRQMEQFEHLDTRRQTLHARIGQYRVYLDGAQPAGLMALVGRRLDESVALSALEMRTGIEGLEDEAQPARLTLRGYARRNHDVARLVNGLEQERAFSQVQLERSREVTVEGRQLYAFEIICQTPGGRALLFVDGDQEGWQDEG